MIFSQKRYTPDPERSFKATKTTTTAIALTTNTPSIVIFNNLIFNTNLVYSSTNGRMTAGTSDTGYWDFVAAFQWHSATVLSTLTGSLYLNGSLYENGFMSKSETTAGYLISSSFLHVPLSVGDYVDFRINSNITTSILQTSFFNATSFFKGRRTRT
jgi:hypothetical protein